MLPVNAVMFGVELPPSASLLPTSTFLSSSSKSSFPLSRSLHQSGISSNFTNFNQNLVVTSSFPFFEPSLTKFSRSYREIDIMFRRRIPARKFKSTVIDVAENE
jgi:hypothetical protein